MKSFKELLQETLNQRHIVDNRQIVSVADINQSVLIAFHQACLDVLNMYNWIWNYKKILYSTQPNRTSYPMPYGIVKGLSLIDQNNNKCPLDFVTELTATQGCPSQWTHDWEEEEIAIAPAEKDSEHVMRIDYYDKNIACVGPRSNKVFLKDFDDSESEAPADNQFLNVPELVYNIYARCIITLARVYLNEGAQPSVLEDQKREFEAARTSLLEFAKTPFYDAQRVDI